MAAAVTPVVTGAITGAVTGAVTGKVTGKVTAVVSVTSNLIVLKQSMVLNSFKAIYGPELF